MASRCVASIWRRRADMRQATVRDARRSVKARGFEPVADARITRMPLEFAERIRRIPAYPVAGGYALPDDVALLASNESPDPPLPQVVEAITRTLSGLNR